jgi:hypothetical protein
MALRLLQAAHALENQYASSDDSDMEQHLSDFEVPSLYPDSSPTPTPAPAHEHHHHHHHQQQQQQQHGYHNPHQQHDYQPAINHCAEDSEDAGDAGSSSDKSEPPRDTTDSVASGDRHNSVEKRRRAYLAQCYLTLKAEVPAVRSIKASNATVLQRAADLIEELCDEEASLLEEIRVQKKIQKDYLTALKNQAALSSSKRKVAHAQPPPLKRMRRDGRDARSPPGNPVPVAEMATTTTTPSFSFIPTVNDEQCLSTSPSLSSPCRKALLQQLNAHDHDNSVDPDEHFQTAPRPRESATADGALEDTVIGVMITGSALEDTVIGLMMLGAGPWAKEGLSKETVNAAGSHHHPHHHLLHHHHHHHHHHEKHLGQVPTVLDDPLCEMV